MNRKQIFLDDMFERFSENTIEDIKSIDKNNKKIDKLIKRTQRRTTLSLYLLFSLITLIPALLLNIIETKRGTIMDIIYHLLFGIIPGMHLLVQILFFALIILFVYSMFTLRKENSRLRKIPFVKRIIYKLEYGRKQKINYLTKENNNIVESNGLDQLPKDYRNYRSINKIYEYFKGGRADTLKDALNLYVSESNQRKQDAALWIQMDRIEKSQNQR